MAVGAASRRYIGPLLCINLVMHAAVLGIAGWSLNKFIDRETHRHLGGNTATGYLLVFSLMAGVVGACSVLPALLHVRAPWHSESLAAAASTGLVSWALTALAFGFCPTLAPPVILACKHITLGNRGRRLRTLEAFITISTLTQLFYLLLLHAGALSSVHGVGQACGNHGEACCREIPRGELAADHKTAGGVPSPDA
ncbi:membrane protein PM19L isoform X1 [Triticum aestivum]|uniref:Uncharacterized protein n=1 Tax=Aegilops tauschii TaxID=37682 RepID=N1QRU2_AEGTA|nr:membrane protein PM19L-like isoform X1 [Triticum aestivum]